MWRSTSHKYVVIVGNVGIAAGPGRCNGCAKIIIIYWSPESTATKECIRYDIHDSERVNSKK